MNAEATTVIGSILSIVVYLSAFVCVFRDGSKYTRSVKVEAIMSCIVVACIDLFWPYKPWLTSNQWLVINFLVAMIHVLKRSVREDGPVHNPQGGSGTGSG